MRRILILSGAVLALAVTGCEPPAASKGEGAPAAAPAFTSEIEQDQSGYYLPTTEAASGGWVFHHLFMGQAADFTAWEAGQRSETFAPIMIEFEDRDSPMVQTELGESRSGRARVLPTSYAVSGDRVRFEGRSERLGAVRFEGRLDAGALAESRRNLGAEGAVLTGTLTVDGRSRRVSLRWWAGD